MKLPGLKRYHVGDTYYVYHRATGKKLPSDLPEDHPDFLSAYYQAELGLPEKAPEHIVRKNSVEDISNRYLKSHAFAALSESYQDVRRRDIDRLRRELDGAVARLPIQAIRDVHIMADMDALSANPANERLKSWRALCDFAIKRKIIQLNPNQAVTRDPTPKTDGHIPWTFDEIARFRAHWAIGTKQRLAFEICYWFGCRISDAIRLGDSNLTHDGWFEFSQQTTGGDVAVPFNRSLPRFAVKEDLEHLKRAMAAMNRRGDTFLETEYGERRSQKAASSWFSKAARAAGIEDRTSHGLRKSRIILHAERGATMKQIGVWSGHESLKEIERYIRKADKKRLLTPSALETGEFY